MSAPNAVDLFISLRAKAKGKPTLDEVKAENKRAMANMQAATEGIYRTPREEINALFDRLKFNKEDRDCEIAQCEINKDVRIYWLCRARGLPLPEPVITEGELI